MPTKNIVKSFDAPAYYHVYNRASGERHLFRDAADREYFIHLMRRHLLPPKDGADEIYRIYDVKVVAYCLMSSHFHLLLYQEIDPSAITGFMRSVGTAYSMYYNRKYKSKGHVFQSAFRASYIADEAYLSHISRYIHLNPRNYATWKWSSYKNYVSKRYDEWVEPLYTLGMSAEQYKNFVIDYARVDQRKRHTQLKDILAA